MRAQRRLRQLAFQALYELDARDGDDAEMVRASLDGLADATDEERDAAAELARLAWAERSRADEQMQALASQWPVHRQAAVDRAILRLAHYEMTSGRTPPKVAVNEAVELAKKFSTDKSPAFINGLLDKVLKRVLADQRSEPGDEPGAESTDEDQQPEARAPGSSARDTSDEAGEG
jgi:N utilization substance protein B